MLFRSHPLRHYQSGSHYHFVMVTVTVVVVVRGIGLNGWSVWWSVFVVVGRHSGWSSWWLVVVVLDHRGAWSLTWWWWRGDGRPC